MIVEGRGERRATLAVCRLELLLPASRAISPRREAGPKSTTHSFSHQVFLLEPHTLVLI